jgi:hypothetical protein
MPAVATVTAVTTVVMTAVTTVVMTAVTAVTVTAQGTEGVHRGEHGPPGKQFTGQTLEFRKADGRHESPFRVLARQAEGARRTRLISGTRRPVILLSRTECGHPLAHPAHDDERVKAFRNHKDVSYDCPASRVGAGCRAAGEAPSRENTARNKNAVPTIDGYARYVWATRRTGRRNRGTPPPAVVAGRAR